VSLWYNIESTAQDVVALEAGADEWLGAMRLYFDTCSLQRPLDERSQTRIVLEAEAILALLTLCEHGQAELVVSDMVVYESNNNPHPQKRQFVMEVINHAKDHVSLSLAIEQRATSFEQGGVKPVDALHLALAEAAHVDYFCTCDDRFYRRAVMIPDLAVIVRQPLELVQELAL
jgi:predicted nucleic acid-binding protein